MKYTLDWLTDPEVFAVNRIAAHSDHRIYANHLEADADNSSLIQNLNSTWKFAWAKNPSEWQQKFYEESDSTDNFDNIQFRDTWNCRDTANRSTSIPFILGRDRSISVRRLSLKRTTLSAATSDILT